MFQHNDPVNELLEKFVNCPAGKPDATNYEILCTQMLKVAFSDDLALWEAQPYSNEKLYRFDLLCRIKDEINKTFWSILEKYFNSKYIIFEFKNYTAPIKQHQVYTTEKYLYKRALRCVAIVIAKNGADDNAIWAAKGCLRESGKLILLLDDKDLINMVTAKINQDDPSEYLLKKLDSLLMELEK